MSNLTLSVVSHGHGPLLHRLLSELDAQPSLAGVRVIVTLNMSDEPFSPDCYAHLELIQIRNPTPQGFGANHNAAFGKCETPWFGILNPDLRLAGTEPFTHLMQSAGAIERCGAIAPMIVGADGQREDAVRPNLTPGSLISRRLLSRRDTLTPNAPAQRGLGFYWLAGMCLVVRASAFRAIGAFDERYFLYCEDYDLCARLFLAGYKVAVDPAVQIVHEARRDSHHSARHLRWHLASLCKAWLSSAFWKVTLLAPWWRWRGR